MSEVKNRSKIPDFLGGAVPGNKWGKIQISCLIRGGDCTEGGLFRLTITVYTNLLRASEEFTSLCVVMEMSIVAGKVNSE